MSFIFAPRGISQVKIKLRVPFPLRVGSFSINHFRNTKKLHHVKNRNTRVKIKSLPKNV